MGYCKCQTWVICFSCEAVHVLGMSLSSINQYLYIYIKHDMHRYLVSAQNYISLLTVYEGNSTFIVPKVPAIE